MKKNGKRLGALLLALVMVLSLVPMTALAARVTDDEIAIDAPEVVVDEATPAGAVDAEDVPAVLAEGETSPDTRYDNWAQLTGSVGSRTKTVPGTKNSVQFQGADYNGHNFNASDGNNSVWTNSTINDALQSYAGDTRWVSFDLTTSQDGVWAVGLWAKNTSAAFQICYKGGGGWFIEYFGSQTGWPDWTTGNPASSLGTTKHSVKFTWTTPTDSTTPAVTLTLDGSDYTVPVDATKITGIDKTTQNFAVRAGNGCAVTLTNVRYSGEPAGQAVSGTVTYADGGAAVDGATVIMGGMTTVTDATGAYSFEYVPQGTVNAAVQMTGYKTTTDEVVVGESAITGKDFQVSLPTRTISGTITAGGNPLEGAKVELVQDNTTKNFVTSVTAVETNAQGEYTLQTTSTAAGSYKIRVSKAGYGAVIGSDSLSVTAVDQDSIHTDVNATLTAINVAGAKFAYDMTEGHRPELGFSNAATKPTSSYVNDALVLDFPNTDRMNNLVKLVGTGVKNGTVEFDATRAGTYTSGGRFGLALRLQNSSEWIYIGSENSDSAWFHEWWNSGQDKWSGTTSGPVFGKGDTRHFKVTIADNTISLAIDGITVINEATIGDGAKNGVNAPDAAADVGFICGNNGDGVPSTITIDNLYISREDPTFTVNLTGTPALTAKIDSSAGDQTLGGGSNDQAAAGDVIKITATNPGDGNVLDAVTVTGADDATVATQFHAAEGSNPAYFTFTMPEGNVSVTGTVLPKVTGVTISGTNKEGKTLTAAVTPAGAAGHVTYQWYHQANANQSAEVDATEAGWTACTDATAATKTVGTDDLNRKVKVVVTGDGTTYAGTVSVDAVTTEVMAAKDTPVTGVSFTRSSLTMWSNLTTDPEGADLGNTATLTAHVAPPNASPAPTYAWSVVDADGNAVTGDDMGIITLATDTTETNTKQITANKAGKVWVKVTVTGGENEDGTPSTASATIPVTVKTGITSITLTKGSDTLNSSSVLTIYANDGDADKTVTVNAAVNAGASAADLVWSCGHDEEGYAHIFQLGGADDAGSAEGASVVISAYNDHELVGEETVTVSAPETTGNTATAVTFKVKVVHKINTSEHSVSVTGTPKVGQELSVSLTNLPMSTTDKGKLTYQWKKDGSDITGATNATYTLGAGDVDGTITVTVTATPAENFYYAGALTSAATAAVAKADAPATPTLSPTKPTQAGESDGYITISNYVNTQTYQIKGGSYTDWTDATVTTDGKIEGLAAGAYSVKVKETATQKESAAATTTIAAGDAVEYTIATQPTEGATISVTDKSAANETVTITLTVTEGYEVTAVKVNGSTDGVTAGENNTWTFTMPAEDVTVTAEVSKKTVKITHSLSEGLSCSLTEHDADGNHVVNYGEVQEITLTAAEGYNLPASITVTYTDGTDVPTTRCEYDNSTGVITFPQGVQRNITIAATATPKTFTASFNPNTGGSLTRAFTSTTPIAYNGTLTATLTPATGYSAPAKTSVEVTVGGTAAEFTYAVNETTGVATITVANVKGNVVIKANSAVKNTTDVTAVTIGIGHSDTTVTSDVPHVGDLLTATVTPTGADVDVQWYAGEDAISGATNLTYTILAADLGKTIKVKVTGTGDYSGEVASAATKAVENYVKLPTDITLDQTTASVEFGKTVTLTATVLPSDATDKTVTWSSSNTAVATVNNGVVTAVGVGSATITAKNSANQTATCAVTVTAAQVGVTLSGTPKAGETLTATITPVGATTRSIHWYRVGADEGGANLLLDNNDQTTYELVEADAGYKIMVRVEGSGNYNTGTVASATTTSPVASENEELPTYSITVAEATGGTVTADKEEASEGEKVTLTVTPADDYELISLTVTGDSGNVEVAEDNTFVMPAEAVTVTATFNEIVVPPSEKLAAAIDAAKAAKKNVVTKPEDTEESTVGKGTKYVTQEQMDELNDAITEAETVKNNADATEEEIEAAANTLKAATETFKEAIKTGTKPSSSSNSSNRPTTSTVTNEDGSTTTTVTKPDGTKTETTEKPDGTKETVETKRDGTVIETVETPDGTVETVKTQPDGTVMEIVVAPDGTKETVETKPDGTKTETVIDPEGAMTEKVTDPEENVVITVTDPEGEELAKLELPATIAEPETKFEDIEGHWAEDSINKVASLGLVNGVGDNKYGAESSLTRGQLATVLYRLSNGKSGYRVSFSDVEIGQYYTEGVAWAAKAKVVTGYTAEIFAPNDIITREQLAVMLCRYAKLIGMDTAAKAESLNAFADGGNTGAWAVNGMAWCVENGILKGRGQNDLDPTANVSRAEVAVMLDRFIGLIK